MKNTDNFRSAIEILLEAEAFRDPLFAKTLEKKNKNITDCCTYILNTVKASGNNGFTDDEILAMAMHYYDEDDIKVGSPVSARVVTNVKHDLSAEEIAKAKKKAYDEVIQEEKDRLKGKNKKPVKVDEKDKPQENTLF